VFLTILMMVFLFYLICVKVALIWYFQSLLLKAGRREFPQWGRGRWSGILSWGVGLAFRALTLDGEAGPLGSPMLPHAGAGSAVGSSSSDPDLDLRLAPPGGSEPVDPAVYQPLLSDEMRKEELGDRSRSTKGH